MKKILFSILLGTVIFALCFFIQPDFRRIITGELASVIGVNINEVIQWSSQRGLKKDLNIGDKGGDVYLLQYAMAKISPNFTGKNIDGYFGKKTSDTLMEFQKANNLTQNGILDSKTRMLINNIYFKELCPDGEGNIFPDEIMIYVNKEKYLPTDYIPDDLIDISPVVKTSGIACVKQEVAPFLKKMFDDAKDQGVTLAVTSAFRRPEVQSVIYNSLIAEKGEVAKDRVAEPLHSEHQLGTTLDLTGKSISYTSANNKFDGSVEELWLKSNAYKYGFVLSYPKDKTYLTNYDYEPWHYRYVGIEFAKEIFDKKLSVEEYFKSLKSL